jgi:amino acid transporter
MKKRVNELFSVAMIITGILFIYRPIMTGAIVSTKPINSISFSIFGFAFILCGICFLKYGYAKVPVAMKN